MSGGSCSVLALDGGGTKTVMVVVDRRGVIEGVRREGGINPFDGAGWRPLMDRMLSHLPGGVAAAGLGLPGYGEDEHFTAEQDHVVRAAMAMPFAVMNDVEMACYGAFAGEPGVLLLSGTGSMAWRHGMDGADARVGGWGALFGDDGSAYWIGREMLKILSQAIDGRALLPPGDAEALLTLVTPCRDSNPMQMLLQWYARLTSPRAQVAALAKGLDELADRGCQTALHIMRAAADQLAAHLRVLHKPDATLAWSYGGSVFASRTILARLGDEFGAPTLPVLPPVGGGLLRAAELAGWPIDDVWIAQLARALRDEKIS